MGSNEIKRCLRNFVIQIIVFLQAIVRLCIYTVEQIMAVLVNMGVVCIAGHLL